MTRATWCRTTEANKELGSDNYSSSSCAQSYNKPKESESLDILPARLSIECTTGRHEHCLGTYSTNFQFKPK